ncbi:hypothetical protein LBMAG42_56870 [Deltaproteobacteria bacterium]|nr:hypothetical protein LBMAG42_56870 [Deltaproteobacteria bacterium]
MIVLFFLAISTALAAPLATCERVFTTTELTDALDSAELNFQKQDAEGFAFSESAVSTRLSCLTEPLVPEVLGRVYLVEALKAVLAKDDAHVAAALAGMASSNPGYQIPLTMIPEGHPVRVAMAPASLLLREPVTTPLTPMTVGWIEVDGVHRTEAPTNRDVVLQRFGGDGQVSETVYVHAGDSLADWIGPPAPPPRAANARPPANGEPASVPLLLRRPVAFRAAFAAVGGGLGDSAAPNPPGFTGPGGRAAAGLELGAGRLGVFAELGWLGLFSPTDDTGFGGRSNGAVLSAGAQLRFGTVTVEGGPAWSISAVHVEGVECAIEGCDGEASSGSGTADGIRSAGGGVVGADVRLGGPDSMCGLELVGGGATDLTRVSYWGGLGIRLGNRWRPE